MFLKEQKICLRKIEASKTTPLELDFVKSYLNISNANEDKSLLSIIAMTAEYAEWYMEKSLLTQKWQISYNGNIPLRIFLPFGPVTNIHSVTSTLFDNTSLAISSDKYFLDSGISCLSLLNATQYSRIDIIYSAGYPDPSLIPQLIKSGILMHTLMVYKSKNVYSESKVDLSKVKLSYDPFKELKLVL